MVASFFNPGWMDLGQLGVYGRWLDINWVWAEMLTIYHAVYSITVSVLLVEMAFPERRNERWVGKKTFWAIVALFGGVVAFGFLLFSSLSGYWTPIPQYLFGVALMVAFGIAAYKLPSNWGQDGSKPLPRPLALWSVGTVGTFAFFLGFWLSPTLMPVWQISMLFGPFLVLVYTRFLKRHRWESSSLMHKFALVSGALTFFIIFAPLQELDKSRPDNTLGMSLVGLAFLLGLLWLRRRVKNQLRHAKEEEPKQVIAEANPT